MTVHYAHDIYLIRSKNKNVFKTGLQFKKYI